MATIAVEIEVHAPRQAVWAALADIGTHDRWMADAITIEFEGQQRQGVGTRFRCPTRVGPLRTNDEMEVTAWDEGTELGVTHRGTVTGVGSFRLSDSPRGTRISWSESLSMPWYFGGRLGGVVARPILTHIWTKNLAKLRQLVERGPAPLVT